VLDTISLDPQAVNATLGVLLKYQEDIARLAKEDLAAIIQDAGSSAA
jgi:hypothetical protein